MRGALIGCGFFGQIQLEAWRRMPEVEIAAACDPDLERAGASAPRAYASAEELLDKETGLDFVDIATRPETHLELVRLASSRGIPMICQKPMAPGWLEAVLMVEAAEQAGVRLIIHENWRWQPWYRVLRRKIAEGAAGQPLTYRFRVRKRDGLGPHAYPAQPYFREMPRLLIYETLVHHLDTARFLFGELKSVFARHRRINDRISGEDQAILLTTHEDGLLGLIDGHRFQEPDTPVLGDTVVEGDDGVLTVTPSGSVLLNGETLWTNDCQEGYRGDSVRAAQQHYLECLRSGEPSESEGTAYLKTVRAVEAAYESAAEGRLVEVA
jgi:D-apiose dehydrogenase